MSPEYFKLLNTNNNHTLTKGGICLDISMKWFSEEALVMLNIENIAAIKGTYSG